MKNIEYTFGTSSTASARLEAIGKFFNPLAADFIRQFVSNIPPIALDLGCGPGFTTNMLAETTGSPGTYGFDTSPSFLEMAGRQFAHCKFLEHDITKIPFPITADVMYARFLLCHLRDPLDVVHGWTTQLKLNGILIVEEVDAIETDMEVFRTYLEMAAGVIATQGTSLYVGKTLAASQYKAEVLFNESIVLPVENWQAASWFFPNTQTIWSENPFVLEHLTLAQRRAIGAELALLKSKRDSISGITWKLRRLVIRTGRT